jgi:predicted SAM-dependent methyltransferase
LLKKKYKRNYKKNIKKITLTYCNSKKSFFTYRRIESKKKWNALIKKAEIKLELGSGNIKGEDGWTTVDIDGADINWDLKRGIPLPNDSVDKIYSSHLLEHIPYEQLIILLKLCRSVLKVNGEFSVCVPNFRLYVDSYKEGKMFREGETWWQQGSIDTGSAIDQLNYIAYMKDEYKYMFDEENLVNTLKKAGFSDVKLRVFYESINHLERDHESIYALAIK